MTHRKQAASQYTAELAHQVNAFLGKQLDEAKLRTVLVTAFSRINHDIVQGKSVQLPFLGDISCSSCSADTAKVRFVADIDLLNECQEVLDAIQAAARERTEPSASEIPIEDWPINEDHRFKRSA